MRTAGELEPESGDSATARAAGKGETSAEPAKVAHSKAEAQGVFLVHKGQSGFQKVTTGIMGPSDIAVVRGLEEGQEIITGSYKVLRTIRPGAKVKVDNLTPARDEK